MSRPSARITVHFVQYSRTSDYTPILTMYRERVRPWTELIERPVKGEGDGKNTIGQEARAIAKGLPQKGRIIALSREGTLMSNDLWHRKMADWIDTPPREIHFIVGGAGGLHSDLLASAGEVISFSRLTLPHRLCRLLLYEQIYRALTVRHGIKYHKTASRDKG